MDDLFPAMMVNFMCQLDWVMGDWSLVNIILSVTVRVFELGEWVEKNAHPNVGNPHPITWSPEWNKKVDTLQLPQVRENTLYLSTFKLFLPLNLNTNISFPEFPAWQLNLQNLELAGPHNCMR
jgi:hypothetical protein